MHIKVRSANSRNRFATLAAMLGVCTFTGGSVQALTQGTEAAGDASPVSAQWQSYDLRFHYFGFSTYYTCTGLEDRLKQVLIDLGADPKMSINASGCFGFNDIGKSLSAHIKVRMPAAPASVEPSAEHVAFPAASKTVNLMAGRAGEVGSGDCELLEQVRNQLLPALKLEVIKDNLHCVPGQGMAGGRGLQVMALIPQASSH